MTVINKGYIAAMCKAGIGSDADEATWSCSTSQGYWTASDSNISKGLRPYHLFQDETYLSSLNRQTMLLNQNLTACLDFNVNYTKPMPFFYHPIKESDIPSH